ncbi:GNAT family N-acetyltransferase [Chitinophaga oryzae]|uniref:GNAT family N-acetyltransferase n=1 Tax=Chitinophaga oryzae TaxID=2725414 RepID=A0AAE7D865_9BACT|nr:GNAT family N-acetyltransferase [Chitinophaga oryzae]QJB32429.1 GNAT family N-acetyltransferase [Chitinophaga oryzae]QJB38901.1 GNAT family N-acetyltransferase [Chitinophaga oryzae]
MMNIRKAALSDMPVLRDLYQGTIRTVNSKDYNPEQVAAWAGRGDRLSSLERRINTQHFYVAETPDKVITGFASLEDDGEFDMMFVHKDFQRQGVATLLTETIIRKAETLQLPSLTAYVSITAKPFFERMGFRVVKAQTVDIDGVLLNNYEMIKHLVI